MEQIGAWADRTISGWAYLGSDRALLGRLRRCPPAAAFCAQPRICRCLQDTCAEA